MLITRRRFIRGSVAAAVGASALAYGMDTHALDFPRIPISLGLNRPLRAVALGDIHFDPLYQEEYLARISREINLLQPDLIFYLGDFLTHNTKRVYDLAHLLGQSKARLGSFGVLGNHDHWASGIALRSALDKNDIRLLTNASFKIPGEDEVYVSGLDSFWAGAPDPSILDRTPKHSRHILLVHEPDAFLQVDNPRVRLQISGHTHGGQIRFPLLGALILPTWGQHFDKGLFTKEHRQLYVNRGVGTLLPHVRFDCPPEITVFEIT